MSDLRRRYWASLTDSRDENPASLDHLIEYGRRRDRSFWRRYLAALFDVEPTEKHPARRPAHLPIDGFNSTAASPVPVPVPVPVRRNWLAVAASVLLVFAAGFGTSFALQDRKASASPVVIGAASTLPAGAREEAGAYAWVPPKGWERTVVTGAEVHYTSPDGKQEVLANSDASIGDLMEQWRLTERDTADAPLDYRKIRLTEATFRGWPAVVWEYTVQAQGVQWHALLVGFDAHGRFYEISTWYRPDIEPRALKTYSVVKDSFTVL